MEAGIHGFGHGEFAKGKQLSDALVFTDTKTHQTSKSTNSKSGGESTLVSDSYTNAKGETIVARPNAQDIVTTRDDVIHAHFERTSQSTSVRNGDVTKTHTGADSTLQKSDRATIVGPNGTATTVDSNRTVTAVTTADSTVKADSKKGTAESSSSSETDFTINADGTITDSRGNKLTVTEVAHGETVSVSEGSSKSSSSTVAKVTHDGRETEVQGKTVSQSTSESERDSKTTYEGVLSSTTANGKTTTRYVDYVLEVDVNTKATTKSVDEFSATSEGATQKSGKRSGTLTQTVDATSDSQSAISSQRTDAVHSSSKPDKDHDATVVKSADQFDARSARVTSFRNVVHIVTDNGAVQTATDRSVRGERSATSETDATIHTTVATSRDGAATAQNISRNTNAHSQVEAQTSYDSTTNSSSSNGASSHRTDRVTSETVYDIHRITHYVAYVRTVVTQAAANSTFAVSA